MPAQVGKQVAILVVCAIDTTAWLLLGDHLRAMRARGWRVTVACTDGPMLRRLEAEGIQTFPTRIARSFAPITNSRAVLRLYRLLRRQRFDVVHVHTPVGSVVGRLAARLAGVQLVVYTAHGFYFHEHMRQPVRSMHVGLERLLGRWTDFLFTQSAEDAKTAIDERIMPEGKVEAIGNGVGISEFTAVSESALEKWREKLELPRTAVVIGTMGRLVEEKGYREFFEAATRVAVAIPSALFLVVGDVVEGDRDPFRTAVGRYLAPGSPLDDRVRFTGLIDEVPEVMCLIDIFVLASYREGMPRSIIEAMAAGKPVVATNIRGCREEVVDGLTGSLVPVRDAQALAVAIETLARDPVLRSEQGLAGRARAELLFDEAKVIKRVLSTIDRLLEDERRPAD